MAKNPVLAAQHLMEQLVESLGQDRRGMTGALLELDPTYDETTLKLWQQSQEAAVKAGAGIAADLSEMYFSGLMELTVVGTVQLVIFYEAEGEYGKAVLAAAPLAPGVLRKGKGLADDIAAGTAKRGKRFTPNQEAVVDLAKEMKLRGRTRPLSSEEVQILKDWADEFELLYRGPEIHPNRPGAGSQPHIHIGPVNHIPVKPGK